MFIWKKLTTDDKSDGKNDEEAAEETHAERGPGQSRLSRAGTAQKPG